MAPRSGLTAGEGGKGTLSEGGGGGGKNINHDGGYSHPFHELGSKKPPGYSIPETKAPDSGSNLKAKGERKMIQSPKLPEGAKIGTQVKPIGS